MSTAESSPRAMPTLETMFGGTMTSTPDEPTRTSSEKGLDSVSRLRTFVPSEKRVDMTQDEINAELQKRREEMATEAEQHLATIREKNRRARYEKLLDRAQIPLRYQDITFDDYIAQEGGEKYAKGVARHYAEQFNCGQRRLRDNSENLIMVGSSRCGKTHLACTIANEVMRKDYTAVVAKLSTILQECRDSFDRDDLREASVLERYTRADLLVLDEVCTDESGSSEFMRSRADYIIDERAEAMLPTIIISNKTLEDIKNTLGFRAYNRITEHMSAALKFTWTPYLFR